MTSVGPCAPALSLSIRPLRGDVLSLMVIFRVVFLQSQLETEVGNRPVAFCVCVLLKEHLCGRENECQFPRDSSLHVF